MARQVALPPVLGRFRGSREYDPSPGQHGEGTPSHENAASYSELSATSTSRVLRPLGGASAAGDADLVPIEPVRPGSSATSEEGILDDGWDGEVERVGGRRRLRGEVVVLAAGLVFLAAAMLKPWAGPAPAPTASPTAPPSPPAVIAAVASPAVTAAPTREDLPEHPSLRLPRAVPVQAHGPTHGAAPCPRQPAEQLVRGRLERPEHDRLPR